MPDFKDYMAGHMAGEHAREFFNGDEVPDPEFDEDNSAVYRKGWWDGFNKFDIATTGISFKSKSEDVYTRLLERYGEDKK